jgi:hypothetical protein
MKGVHAGYHLYPHLNIIIIFVPGIQRDLQAQLTTKINRVVTVF